MEAMQANGLFRKSTGMVNPDGKPGGRLEDRLRKQTEEKRMDGKVCQEFELQLGLNS
jgi:hypothetical protein